MTNLDPEFAREAQQISKGEVAYAVEEMFFSRTDMRGVIQSGNTVFQRLSGYEWDKILGAPHKLVRHPDMPRGVFELMWSRLKADHSVGCYVKNRARDGRHYWVFALVTPIADGYLSTRIKPTSAMFEQVQALYADLLATEAEKDLSPADSALLLQQKLQALGFADYGDFQSSAMAAEFQARAKKLGQELDPIHARFLEMSDAIANVARETDLMTEAFQKVRTVPMNMGIIASRLENAGGPIGAISVNYSQMLEEMTAWVKSFVDGKDSVYARMRDAIMTGQFLGFSAEIQTEMQASLESLSEDLPERVDVAAERAHLEQATQDYHDACTNMLLTVEKEARRFARSVLDMKRYVTGLSSTRMMCKIESASLSASGSELAGVVDQLDSGQDEIENRLARIVELNAVIQGSTTILRSLI